MGELKNAGVVLAVVGNFLVSGVTELMLAGSKGAAGSAPAEAMIATLPRLPYESLQLN